MPRKYPKIIKKEVRERIKNGESKLSVSQDMNIPYGTSSLGLMILKEGKVILKR